MVPSVVSIKPGSLRLAVLAWCGRSVVALTVQSLGRRLQDVLGRWNETVHDGSVEDP